MKKIEHQIKKFILLAPYSIQKIIVRTYHNLIYFWVKSKTWWKYSRYYRAPLKPFKLYYIDPENIKTKSESLPSKPKYSGVLPGDWDLVKAERNETPTYVAFKRRFVEGVDWKDTFEYQNAVRRIESNKIWNGCQSTTNLDRYFEEYDQLFEDIKNNGYKKQSELDSGKNSTTDLHDLELHPPELREVTVDIARNGDCICTRGGHRIAMARLLNIEEIPVRIRNRHESWQKKRDEIYEKNIYGEDHIDLQF